jgi:hypothetical protein
MASTTIVPHPTRCRPKCRAVKSRASGLSLQALAVVMLTGESEAACHLASQESKSLVGDFYHAAKRASKYQI